MEPWPIAKEALTIASGAHAVNTEAAVLLLDLARLDGGQSLDRAQTGVLRQSQWNGVKCISKGTHGVLLDARALNSICQ